MSKTVLYNWNVWKVRIRSQRLAQVCEICLHGSNLALQHASQINSVTCNSSISFYYYYFLFCMTFVYLSLLSIFLGTLELKCVLVWLPELSAVIQRDRKVLKEVIRYFFLSTALHTPCYSYHGFLKVYWKIQFEDWRQPRRRCKVYASVIICRKYLSFALFRVKFLTLATGIVPFYSFCWEKSIQKNIYYLI